MSTVKAVIKLMQNMKLTMEQTLDTLEITVDEQLGHRCQVPVSRN